MIRFLDKLIRIEKRMISKLSPSMQQQIGEDEITREEAEQHDDEYYYELAQNMRKTVKRGVQEGFEEIISLTPILQGQHILDIGIGVGSASKYFCDKGCKVTATGTYSSLYGNAQQLCEEREVDLIECYVENLPFENLSFDAVWMSHVLEHSMNTGVALQEVRRVIKREGWLFIIVPKYKSRIVGGHLIPGWNVGQLMYVLLLNGFNVKKGHFANIKGNICAFVKKAEQTLPTLHHDYGDLEALTNYWPIEIRQGSEGDINNINWDKLYGI